MMTLEQIRQRNKAENAAAQRLQAAGYRLEGAGRAGDRVGGPLLIGQADTTQAGQIGQVVTVGGAVLPGADRGRGRRALVPAAPDPPARGTRHGSRWHCSRAAQFRRRMIRQNAAGRRGQILHLTAYRPIGNGELGSMPPYYPLLAPFFPGFGVVFRPL